VAFNLEWYGQSKTLGEVWPIAHFLMNWPPAPIVRRRSTLWRRGVEVVEGLPDSASISACPRWLPTHAPATRRPSQQCERLSFIEMGLTRPRKVRAADAGRAPHTSSPRASRLRRHERRDGGNVRRLRSRPSSEEDALAGRLRADSLGSCRRRLGVLFTPRRRRIPTAPIADADDSALDLLAPISESNPPPGRSGGLRHRSGRGGPEKELVADALEAPAVEIGDSDIDLGKAQVLDPASSEELSGIVIADSSLHLVDADAHENPPQAERKPARRAGRVPTPDRI